MQGLREFGNALVVTMLSVGLMFGALSISLVEFAADANPTITPPLFPSPLPVTATNTLLPTATADPSLDTPTPTVTNTTLPPVSCQPPTGWIPVFIQPTDTLDILAARYRISKDALRQANCLLSDSLIPGTILYVSPAPTSTVVACSQGAAEWVKSYVVKPGDTLYSIANNHYTNFQLLKIVNCRHGDQIYAGEILWVPSVSTRTPIPTPLPGSTITPYPTDPLTQTALPFTATLIPTAQPATTVAPTATPIPTHTASPTAFPTSTP
ncbi:MAG: LysM peptidoglycan-binding domain-containing protein [Anaerolineales bacterium]|nr:LysM peptidoglycan-binding domain-containing protein [Anaerolineales bacterium]